MTEMRATSLLGDFAAPLRVRAWAVVGWWWAQSDGVHPAQGLALLMNHAPVATLVRRFRKGMAMRNVG
jgi:hypothetical protein